MKEYKITKERLEAMAKKCPESKEVLKEGFPEAFEEKEKKKNDEEWVDVTEDCEVVIDSTGNAYWANLLYEGIEISFMGFVDVSRNFEEHYHPELKIERFCDAFRVLKRRSK